MATSTNNGAVWRGVGLWMASTQRHYGWRLCNADRLAAWLAGWQGGWMDRAKSERATGPGSWGKCMDIYLTWWCARYIVCSVEEITLPCSMGRRDMHWSHFPKLLRSSVQHRGCLRTLGSPDKLAIYVLNGVIAASSSPAGSLGGCLPSQDSTNW